MNCMTTKFSGLLWYFQHKACVKKIHIDSICMSKVNVMLKFKKNLQIFTFLSFFFISIFGPKIRVLDQVHDYLIILFCCSIPSKELV